MNDVTQGSLFSTDFLSETIIETPDWAGLSEEGVAQFLETVSRVYSEFPTDGRPNESQTEDDLIWLVLGALGWEDSLRQQNLSAKGRDDVPDGLLFADDATKAKANEFVEEWKRYEFGLCVVESKRWLRPLDRRSGRKGEETAPSTQMLRYLRRVDDLTTGDLRWGILTNGQKWRLYYQGARSVSEQFFEIDLAQILDIPGHNDGLFALNKAEQAHWVRVFLLVFGKLSFLESSTDKRTFHQRALDESRYYEERVSDDLSNKVFANVFPTLVKAFADADPEADLQTVREAALIFLYRLLFIFFAEDRDLLPVTDTRYDDYALRDKVRGDVGARKDKNDVFSETASRYWSTINDLCRAIDKGDGSIGLPPYNGGLFDEETTPFITSIRIGDSVLANVIDALSFEEGDAGRKYINYRNLSVQQLGSIYERLLEYEVVREEDQLFVRPNKFARKGSGSYYTPDDLVGLIIRETVAPLVERSLNAFAERVDNIRTTNDNEERKIGRLGAFDPAEALLGLKICDPAMGSGHFLVSLVDYLADQVIAAMGEAEAMVEYVDYISPLTLRISDIRNRILSNAEQKNWTLNEDQLDDRHIIRRMILKRCIFGVDKNPMAVELAKVSLWLHTFTVGAPLSFLDHHLICGDSLFGMWVRDGLHRANKYGELFLREPLEEALEAASGMQEIEMLTDAEIAEAHKSADLYSLLKRNTGQLDLFLSFLHALDWLDLRDKADATAIASFIDGQFGDPFKLLQGKVEMPETGESATRFASILQQVRTLISEERFQNWQVNFPGIWTEWDKEGLNGGFDAVIGNPPWDRMKMQEVEWFAARKPEIASAQRQSERKALIKALEDQADPLANEYAIARARAETALKVARKSVDYPLLSGGDVNLYSLFVERALQLVKPDALVGLLVPSGIASDKTASKFFKGVSTEGRLKAFYDFENRRTRYDLEPFFADVDSRFKFAAFVAGKRPTSESANCAFFLQSIEELKDEDRRFVLSANDFARLNPNTGTAPIFRSRRDANLTSRIYENAQVLVDRSSENEVKAWPVRYSTMFHMTNDSGLFRTQEALEEKEGAYPKGGNIYGSASGDWVPLYVGRMIHQFDHRSASVTTNTENVHNAALSADVSSEQKANPDFVPTPQYWVPLDDVASRHSQPWAISFRDIARSTDVRTMIASAVPEHGCGNTLPLILHQGDASERSSCSLLLGNLNALVFDYVTRQKAQSTHLNWYIVEQLPVIPLHLFEETMFGSKSADEIIREVVLEMTYTAHDMAPFARDMGYVDDNGEVKPPFVWDDERRLKLRAKLDAVFFHLYNITDREDVRYIYSTFPIVAREENAAYGKYQSLEMCLAYISALSAGDPDAEITLQS